MLLYFSFNPVGGPSWSFEYFFIINNGEKFYKICILFELNTVELEFSVVAEVRKLLIRKMRQKVSFRCNSR